MKSKTLSNTSKKIYLPPQACLHLLWGMHLLAKQMDLSQFRFYAKPGMGIRVLEIDSIKASKEKDLYEVWINYGGIDGTSGPLPVWLNELLSQEATDDHQPLGDFINIFSHRLTLLLYKAWLKHKAFLVFHPEGKDIISQTLLALIGQSDADIIGYSTQEKIRMLSYVSSLGHRPRSAASLLGMLRHYFRGIPIEIKSFMKRSIRVPEENQARIGKHLIANTILGQRMSEISGAFRIIVGPVSQNNYSLFLPKQPYYIEMVKLVNTFVSDLLEWDIELRLKAEEIPELKIGKKYFAKLGQNTWFDTPHKQEGVVYLSVQE